MNVAELVGGVLYQAMDPEKAAKDLANLLRSNRFDPESSRASGFEPVLVHSLMYSLPKDPEEIELACAKGAAWVLGRRSAPQRDSWELVATFSTEMALPHGLRRTTAETLILLATEAEHYLKFAAPFIDSKGMGFLAESIAAATSRGVAVEVLKPERSKPGLQALDLLRNRVTTWGNPALLTLVSRRKDAPWPHLKVMIADGSFGYIGSANFTVAGLATGNLELGVLVRGAQVEIINSILDAIRAQ